MSTGPEYLDYHVHAKVANQFGFNFLPFTDSDYPLVVMKYPFTVQIRLRTINLNKWWWQHKDNRVECTWRGQVGDDRGWLKIPHGALFIGVWPTSLIPLQGDKITSKIPIHTAIHETSSIGKDFDDGEWVNLMFPETSKDGDGFEPGFFIMGMNDDLGTFADNYGVIHIDIKFDLKPGGKGLQFPIPQNEFFELPIETLRSKIEEISSNVVRITDVSA